MNKNAFYHLITLLQYPETAAIAQANFDKERIKAAENAAAVRPHFLSVDVALPNGVQSLPVSEPTEPVKHPVIITGAITDSKEKKISYYRDIEDRPKVRSKQSKLTLSIDAVFGHTLATGGFVGVNKINPFILPEDETITIQIFRDVAGDAETVHNVLTGYRVYKPNYQEGNLTPEDRRDIQQALRYRPTPEDSYLIAPVEFKADGISETETPPAEEPLAIVGFRITAGLENSLVNLGFDNESSLFSKKRFPIWALASEATNSRQIVERLMTPFLLRRNQKLLFNLKNTIDGVNFAENGQIEVICKTM